MNVDETEAVVIGIEKFLTEINFISGFARRLIHIELDYLKFVCFQI